MWGSKEEKEGSSNGVRKYRNDVTMFKRLSQEVALIRVFKGSPPTTSIGRVRTLNKKLQVCLWYSRFFSFYYFHSNTAHFSSCFPQVLVLLPCFSISSPGGETELYLNIAYRILAEFIFERITYEISWMFQDR